MFEIELNSSILTTNSVSRGSVFAWKLDMSLGERVETGEEHTITGIMITYDTKM